MTNILPVKDRRGRKIGKVDPTRKTSLIVAQRLSPLRPQHSLTLRRLPKLCHTSVGSRVNLLRTAASGTSLLWKNAKTFGLSGLNWAKRSDDNWLKWRKMLF
jgi:hypothetical protein